METLGSRSTKKTLETWVGSVVILLYHGSITNLAVQLIDLAVLPMYLVVLLLYLVLLLLYLVVLLVL